MSGREKGPGATGLALGAIAVFLAAGGVMAEEPRPFTLPDIGAEIQAQGAAALERMTGHLEPGSRWGELGATELASVLQRQAVTDSRVAGAIKTDCKRCHEDKERG